MRSMKRVGFGAAVAFAPGLALAQAVSPFDVTSVTETITYGVAAIGVIGVAMLGLKIVKTVWKKIG